MTEKPSLDSLDQLAKALETTNKSLSDVYSKLNEALKQVRRNRTHVVILAVSVCFDLLLSVGFFVSLHRTNDAVTDAKKANAAAKEICESRNEAATRQHDLWNGIITLTADPAKPTDPAILVSFNQLIDTTFPQTDCSQIGN